MAFSEKQDLFANYLLEKIGFKDSVLIQDYKRKLESVHGRYHQEQRTEHYPNGYVRYYTHYRYSNSECIKELLNEIDIKKNLGSIVLKKFSENSKISATDLSSFNFCPASYSISKSFEIEHPTGEDKRLEGINLHETLRLIGGQIPDGHTKEEFVDYEVLENEQISKIKKCELIFAGHSNDKKYFENKSKNFIGQPDYIFRDPNGKLFVVEEKFKYFNNYLPSDDYDIEEMAKERDALKKVFYSNHIVQLSSYIENIQEYDIDYGVLIYWFYDFYKESPNIHSVSLKVVKTKEYTNLLDKTHSDLKKFIANKLIDFDYNINPKKCAACSVNKYCGHKTDEVKSLRLPYNRYNMRLKYAEFPEELKKQE